MITYFPTLAQTLAAAFETAIAKGYSIVEDSANFEHVAYETTQRKSYELTDAFGKTMKKSLHVIVYRMSSGSYELTSYIQ